MAVSATNLINNYSNTDATSYTTASVSPSANNLLLLSVVNKTNITTNPNQPTITGNGLTWVAVNTSIYDNTGASRRRLTVYRALGASPSAGTITIDCGGQTQVNCMWSLDQFSGIDTSGTNGSGAVVQSAVNAYETSAEEDTQITATLAAFGSTDNATFGAIGNGFTSITYSVGSGFTQLCNFNDGVEASQLMATEWKATNDTSVDFTFSDLDYEVGIIGVEIKAAAVASTVKTLASLGVG